MDHLNSTQPFAVITHPSAYTGSQPAQRSTYGLENFEGDDSVGGLMEYWRVLVRNKRLILLAAVLGLILGVAVALPLKPIFRAQTTLEVLTINENYMNMKQASPTTTNDGNYDTSEEQTQAKLLQGNALIERVIAKLDPGASTTPPKPKIATTGWRKMFHLLEPVKPSARQKLLAAAAKSLKVKAPPRTRILELTVDSTDSQLAKDFANTLTQEFIALSLEARWATIQRTSEWLRSELDDARGRLQKSEDALQNYARNSGLIFIDQSTDSTSNVATEKLQQVQQNLSAAIAKRIGKQARYELAQSAPPNSLGDVLQDDALREVQSKVNDLKGQIADLSAVYDPEYSKVRRLQAQLDTLQPAYERERADIITRIKNDYTEAERQEKLLADAYDFQAREVTGQDQKAIQYNILKRDVDSNRQLYDTMLQQMKQASISSAMRASNVRVTDLAELPAFPVFPDLKVFSAVGLLTGLFLSVAAVTIRERADRTLQQPGDIKTWTDLAELGVIPTASRNAHRLLHYQASDTARSNMQPRDEPKGLLDGGSVELITLQKKPSLIAEAFRSALTSILFVGENGARPKVLVFTSTSPADGKTTVVCNIAIAAAEIRMRVLVIDVDLRRPRMHAVFNIDNKCGLTDLLQRDAEHLDPRDFIKQTEVENLCVLPAGPATQAAAHLLYSPNFAALLSNLRNHYDMILVDTPPMLQMTDARVAGRLSDAVILVARSGVTSRDAIVAAKERFAEDRIHVLGAVLNNWNPKQANGSYGYYRNNYYSSVNKKYFSNVGRHE